MTAVARTLDYREESRCHLDEARRREGAVRPAREGLKCGQRSAGRDFEDRADTVGAALLSDPVQIPIGGLDQPCVGEAADPKNKRVWVQADPGLQILEQPAVVSADPILPGFTLDLTDIFS